MSENEQRPRVAPTDAAPEAIDTDVLLVPVLAGQWPAVPGLDEAAAGEVGRALATGEFTGKLYQVFVSPLVSASWSARRVMLVGAGPADRFTTERGRHVATAAARAVRERRGERLAFLETARPLGADGQAVTAEAAAQAFTEGLALARFDAAQYKTGERALSELRDVQVAVGGAVTPAVVDAVRRGDVLGWCSNLARTLANEPGNRLPPRVLAERALHAVGRFEHLDAEVLDEPRIRELGMNLLAGVGQGSHEPPRLIVLRYRPPGAPSAPVLGLVGKGITFDTGGISIKASAGMDRMKDDMAGGAAVIAAMRAIAELRAPVRVVGVVPAAENMPGGGAIRPGDVLRSADGITVEVTDTDAEGRLALADGLWYARREGATHLVDIATLTGACLVALGRVASGLFGRPDAWLHLVHRVAGAAGDRSWPLPLFEEYREQLESEIADLMNVGGRPAGAATAATFLAAFTGDLPWAHLDIAGTAWNEEAKPYLPKGPTGVGVRTLAGLAFEAFPQAQGAD
jgi:leucyl aminopeptidase